MSILHVGHIQAAIEKRFKGLIDLSDVAESQREDCFLTRGLSAFVVAELSGTDDQAAAASVVDCPRDNGIDAFYFDAAELVCYLVQSKWTKNGDGSVDVGSVLKFGQGIHDFFQADLARFGPKMKNLQDRIEQVLGDSRVTFVIVLAYTGQQALSGEASGPLEKLVSDLNDPTELVELRVLRQGDLHSIVAEQATGETINLQIMLKEWGAVKDPYMAYYGQVDLKDIATWGKFGQHLYAKNLRGFKGHTDVNEGIINTVRNQPQNFWYFNNGVTVVATKVTPRPLGSGTQDARVFECEGASVINGAQTVGSIISAISSGGNGIQNARAMVRIISLEDCPPEFGVELTRAANTQNRIESKDFVAQDPQQQRLQTELYLENNKRYAYRSGDQAPAPDEGLTFEEAAVALACAHPDLGNCVQAKREVSKLWEDITKAPYKVLFNAGTGAVQMWRSVEIMRSVEAELKAFQAHTEGKPRLIATHGNRVILHAVFKAYSDPTGKDWVSVQSSIPELVLRSLASLIDATKKHYDTAYPSNLFKNLSKCKDLAAEMGIN
jgi:hypothetical protein